MNKKQSSEPLLLYYFTKFVKKIIPIYTAKHLLIEGFIISLLFSTIFYLITNSILLSFVLFINIIFISLTKILLIPNDKQNETHEVLGIKKLEILILTFISLFIPLFIFYILLNNTQITLLSIILVFIYLIFLYKRSKKYLNPTISMPYYTELNNEWLTAYIYLEHSIKHYNKQNYTRAYFWSKYSEYIYVDIIKNENKKVLQQAASEFSIVSNLLSTSCKADNFDKLIFIKIIKKQLKKATELLYSRECNYCEQIYKINKINLSNNKNNKFICDNCIKNNLKNKKQKYNISIKKAKNILEINKITKDNIYKSYREKVKYSHPDVGGSKKEFIQLKNARDRLLKEI